MEEISSLEELKKDYKVFEKKYSLPSFTYLNEEFSIEKISETETDLLLKEIRRYIAEKIIHYSNFIEAILNPSNQSLFIFSFIRSMNPENKEIINNIYKKLSRIRLNLIKIDTIYSEEKEAEFIKYTVQKWDEIKEDLLRIFEEVEKNFGETNQNKNSIKDYFR